jgi:hypothetical protein
MFLLASRLGCRVAGGELRHSIYNPKRELRREAIFLIWIRRNPLKSPESAKGIQGKTRNFPWIYLDFLAFICREIAFRL